MSDTTVRFSKIEEALATLASGGMVIVADDENRENEGDFIVASRFATPEAVNFLATEGRGLLCAALTEAAAQALGLEAQHRTGNGAIPLHGTAFTQSVDYVHGTSTGISAADRSASFRALADPCSKPGDFARPGHVFPLVARNGGVLERRGHTEATVDLCRLAGLAPAGVLCEILNPDGSMARLPELMRMASRLGLPIVSVEDLVTWRRGNEGLLAPEDSVVLPTSHGDFNLSMFSFPCLGDAAAQGPRPLALVYRDGSKPVLGKKPDDSTSAPPLVRIHSECMTGDVFGSTRCDCGEQLEVSMQKIHEEGRGAVVYLRQEGRGIGLNAKLRAYKLQEQGYDTWDANTVQGYPPDARDYWEAAQILKYYGWTTVRLLTNNPAKVKGLEKYGITVAETVPVHTQEHGNNRRYLETKRLRFGHFIRT